VDYEEKLKEKEENLEEDLEEKELEEEEEVKKRDAVFQLLICWM